MNIISVRVTAPSRATFAVLALLLQALATGCRSVADGASAAEQRSYGTYMARRGFWREALFRYQRADLLRPGDPRTLNDLAVAWEATGEPARALAAYRRALELAPEEQKIKRNYARFAEYYASAQRPAAATSPSSAAPPATGAEAPR